MRDHESVRRRHPHQVLTTRAVQARHAPGRIADGNGLYLLVGPTGSKSWVLRTVVHGTRRDIGLGSVRLISLAEARRKPSDCGRSLGTRAIPCLSDGAGTSPPSRQRRDWCMPHMPRPSRTSSTARNGWPRSVRPSRRGAHNVWMPSRAPTSSAWSVHAGTHSTKQPAGSCNAFASSSSGVRPKAIAPATIRPTD